MTINILLWKLYVDYGNGDEETIDKMIGEITKIDCQTLDTLFPRPKFKACSGKSDKIILAKIGRTVLG